jgi:hypothetical protein
MMQTAIDKLRELRALHEDGLLSRQEFDSRKNAILDAAYPADSSADPPPAAPVRAGTEIGLMATQEVGPVNRRYRLERLIAQGGMGEVWQATDLATHAELGHSAQVALKILPPRLTENSLHAKLLIEEGHVRASSRTSTSCACTTGPRIRPPAAISSSWSAWTARTSTRCWRAWAGSTRRARWRCRRP